MNISKITIGRLFNLGNYEHIRYEVTVDVAPGESAAQAVRGLENIMAGLKPVEKIAGVKSLEDLKRAEKKLQLLGSMNDEQWTREWGHCDRSRAEILNQLAQELEEKGLIENA